MDNWMKVANMSEEEARDTLEAIRWPAGVICPKCGSAKGAWKMQSKPETKKKMRPGLYKCKACTQKFTVTMGTIFEDSHIPLNKWLMAIYLLNASKKGISAHQLHRMLGITYKSAWFMAHRIRYAMTQAPLQEKLTGIIEVDETYIGGKEKYKHPKARMENAMGKHAQGGSTKTKTPVFALVQRDGQMRAQKLKIISGKTVKRVIREHISPDATIMTDKHQAYKGLAKEFARHETIDHGIREYVRGDVYTNTVESWFGLLKRGVMGTFHHISEQHLDRYVDEFVFRHNNREITDAQRAQKAIRGAEGKRLVYKETIKKRTD